jgi:hypothetical protein
MNATFKKHPPATGLLSMVMSVFIDIKVKKQKCGQIIGPNYHNDKWRIGFTVKNEEGNTSNCPWLWVHLKHTATDEASARQWVKDHIDRVDKKYGLWFADRD